MAFLVKDLIEGKPAPVTIGPCATLRQAFGIMKEYDFSQLPVVDESNHILGMVTHESILRVISYLNSSLDELLVRDAKVDSLLNFPEDDLFDLLNRLRDTNSVLIQNIDRCLVGIVTSYDSTEYFRERAQDIMLVEDIESMLKDVILFAYTDQKTVSLDETRLVEAIYEITTSTSTLKKKFRAALGIYQNAIGQNNKPIKPDVFEQSFKPLVPDQPTKKFKDLTLNEYIVLLMDKWDWLHDSLKLSFSKKALSELLFDVRETRNSLAHFRGKISAVERDRLQFFSKWLSAQHQLLGDAKPPQTIPVGIMQEEPGSIQTEIAPIEEAETTSDSRYAPLAEHLRSLPREEEGIQLTFDQIEAIIGGELPDSARQHRSWWANDWVGHVQSKQWLNVGWRVSYINMSEGRVTFYRTVERQQAYIAFFNALIADLKKKHKTLPIKQTNPNGQSFIIIIDIPKNGPQLAFFAFSFARDRRFRVELYIDVQDQARNKAIFDQLYAQKDAYQSQITEPIKWERLDNRRASRIAVYQDGEITDSEGELAEIRKWGVDQMARLYQALAEPASKILRKITRT